MNNEARQPENLDDSHLDHLLAEASHEPIGLPLSLAPRIESSIRRSIRQRRILGGSLVAITIAALTIWLTSPSNTAPPPVIVERPPSPVPAVPSAVSPRPVVQTVVTVQPADDANVIAVPIETDNPNITIVWLYPTVQTASSPAMTPADAP